MSGLGVDRVTRARRYDYSLSAATPVYPDSNFYAEETPLEVDVHEGAELGVVLAGAQERRYEDLVVPVRPGDVWLCAAWEPHGWRVTSPKTRDLVLIFLPEFLGEEALGNVPWLSLFAVPPSERPRVASEATREKVLALGLEMYREIREQGSGWESVLRLDSLRLLLALCREWRPPPHSWAQSRRRANNLPRIMPALTLAHSRPERRVSLGAAAAACGLSRAQFCLIFRNTMGMSFGRFCLQSRLGFVARLLMSTDSSTEVIAQQTGFSDGSHLHRAFVRQYGCTPGAYRARRQSQAASSTARVRGERSDSGE